MKELITWPSQLRSGSDGEQEQRAQTVVVDRTRPGGGWTPSGYGRRVAVGERVRGASERGGHAQLLEEPEVARDAVEVFRNAFGVRSARHGVVQTDTHPHTDSTCAHVVRPSYSRPSMRGSTHLILECHEQVIN